MIKLIPYLMAGLAFAAVAVAQPAPQPGPAPAPQVAANSPRRLTISVSLQDPEDLAVKEGDRVKAGDLIADRGRERQRLEFQQQQLVLTAEKLRTAAITPPLPPAPVPPLAELPPNSYLEQEAAIARAQASVEAIAQEIELKKQEIGYLENLAQLDPLVLEHEHANLAELQRSHTTAIRDYQVTVGKLNSAREASAYNEYQHGLSMAQRVEQANQAALAYQQQMLAYEQRLRDRDYQVSQTELKLAEVEDAIAALAVVRAPYDGRVRRVRWLGQGTDGALNAEIVLLVSSGDGGGAAMSEQPAGMSSEADRDGDRPQP